MLLVVASLLAVLGLGGVLAVFVLGGLDLGVWTSAPEITAGGEDDGSRPADGKRLVGAAAEPFTVWERNDDGSPVRWDACSPILLEVATADVPPTVGAAAFVADVEEAVARLRAASGLDLVMLGTTDERPSNARPPYHPEREADRWAPVLVGWADPTGGPTPLRDVDRGVGIPVAVGPAGDRTYVSGQVVLNAARTDLRPGYEDRATSWGATILHELAHVLGLGHVADPDALMSVHPGSGPVDLADGDLAGLAAVGAEAGCRKVPTPRVVDVAEPPRTHGVPLDR